MSGRGLEVEKITCTSRANISQPRPPALPMKSGLKYGVLGLPFSIAKPTWLARDPIIIIIVLCEQNVRRLTMCTDGSVERRKEGLPHAVFEVL